MKKLIPIALLCVLMLTACGRQTAHVSFKANATTGYTWTCQTDPSITVNSEYTVDSADSDMVGAGGTENFVIKPTKDGNFHLTFLYARDWEEGVAAKAEYDIEVKNGKITETYASCQGVKETHLEIK